jgi:hypothetical protein
MEAIVAIGADTYSRTPQRGVPTNLISDDSRNQIRSRATFHHLATN